MLVKQYLRPALLGGFVAIAACEAITTNFSTSDYNATATVTYTWHVRYNRDSGQDRPNDTRIEKFAAVSLEIKTVFALAWPLLAQTIRGCGGPNYPPSPR